MNSNWLNFLGSQKATFLDDGKIQFIKPSKNLTSALYPVPQLAPLKVTGKDALPFLQGQLTCHVKALTTENSFFAAFCNAKGRMITTLLIFKQKDDFFLILPRVLLNKVQKKLQMYVLRSDVHLNDASDEFCISGLCCSPEQLDKTMIPKNDFARQHEIIKLPKSRYLMIATVSNSIKQWSKWLSDGLLPQHSWLWDYLDISAGLAWLNMDNSEHYIPQMLNLDKLGGISFDKGCYTGQEVVARTHYLGKTKRGLFIAECAAGIIFEGGTINNKQDGAIAKIISAAIFGSRQKLLVVMAQKDEKNLHVEQKIKFTAL